MSTITLDLINDLLLSENTGHSLSVKAHDSNGEYGDSTPGTMILYCISGEGVSSNLSMTKDKVFAVQGQALTLTLTAAQGFVLPQSVGVFVNGAELSSGYQYNASTGVISIDGTRVCGTVGITARGTRTVTFSGVGVSSNGAEYVADNSAYSAVVSANYGFMLPDSITVKVGGATLAASNYSWNASTGELSIPQNKITGAVEITANAKVQVTLDGGTYLDIIGAASVTVNTGYSCTVAVKAGVTGYTLPATVTVTVAGQALASGAYTWNKNNGVLTIAAASVTGAISVSAQASDLPSLAAPVLSLSNRNLTITPDDSSGECNQLILFKDGQSSPAITFNRFKIGTSEYFCESGMSWFSWVGSDYNTDGFVCSASGSAVSKNSVNVKLAGITVLGSDTIRAGGNYTNNG